MPRILSVLGYLSVDGLRGGGLSYGDHEVAAEESAEVRDREVCECEPRLVVGVDVWANCDDTWETPTASAAELLPSVRVLINAERLEQ